MLSKFDPSTRITFEDAMKALDVSKGCLYEKVRTRAIGHCNDGRRTFFFPHHIEEYFERSEIKARK